MIGNEREYVTLLLVAMLWPNTDLIANLMIVKIYRLFHCTGEQAEKYIDINKHFCLVVPLKLNKIP